MSSFLAFCCELRWPEIQGAFIHSYQYRVVLVFPPRAAYRFLSSFFLYISAVLIFSFFPAQHAGVVHTQRFSTQAAVTGAGHMTCLHFLVAYIVCELNDPPGKPWSQASTPPPGTCVPSFFIAHTAIYTQTTQRLSKHAVLTGATPPPPIFYTRCRLGWRRLAATL